MIYEENFPCQKVDSQWLLKTDDWKRIISFAWDFLY